MPIQKSFHVFGERVDVLVSGQMSQGRVAVVTQISPPGGPPHIHEREDETFTVLEGDCEIFDRAAWHPLRQGESHFGERGKPHTFRCTGEKEDKMHVVAMPAGLDEYLERISSLSMPEDMSELMRISEEHGSDSSKFGPP